MSRLFTGPVMMSFAALLASTGCGPTGTPANCTFTVQLAQHPGILVSKSQLEDALFAFGAEVESNAVEVYVSRLRKKLGNDLIHTSRGLGYRLEAR